MWNFSKIAAVDVCDCLVQEHNCVIYTHKWKDHLNTPHLSISRTAPAARRSIRGKDVR
jgi:hypothetical protein